MGATSLVKVGFAEGGPPAAAVDVPAAMRPDSAPTATSLHVGRMRNSSRLGCRIPAKGDPSTPAAESPAGSADSGVFGRPGRSHRGAISVVPLHSSWYGR